MLSSPAILNAQAGVADVPTNNMLLWLKADSGLKIKGTSVSAWTSSHDATILATQQATSKQPTYVGNWANGQPAVRFDGQGQYMTFKSAVNGLSALTLILVGSSEANVNGGTNGCSDAPLYWDETAQWGTVHLSPFQSVVRYRFGTGEASNLPSYTRPSSIGASPTLTTAIKNGSVESLYVNGSRVLAQSGKLSAIANVGSVGYLGRGCTSTTFNGAIAEVLAYSRALSDAERQQVESYLIAKYGLAAATPVNTPPQVNAGADQSISLPGSASLQGTVLDDGLPNPPGAATSTWSKVSGPGSVSFANSSSPSTTATFSAAGTYLLQLSATDGQYNASDTVSVVVSSNTTATTSIPVQNLKLWLKADAGVTSAGGLVSQWADQSGSGTVVTQGTSTNQPSLMSNVVNGKPVVRFDGVNDHLNFNLPVNGLSGMTIAIVTSSMLDLPASNAGTNAPIMWNETGGWGMIYVNPLAKNLQWRFGTGQSLNLPTYSRPASIGSAFSLTTIVKNGSTEYGYVNGSLVLTETGKLATLANVSDAAALGRNLYDNSYFPGDIAEVIVYTRALSDTERGQVEQYLLTKYGTSQPPAPVNTAPTVNAGANQTITLPSAATLSGTASDDGLPSGVLTTSWSAVSGPGAVAFGNSSALSTTATFAAAGTYVLRLTASDGSLTSTSDVTIAVISNTVNSSPVPMQNLKLWLKADAGVTSSGGLVSGWADQSGTGTTVSQPTSAGQPTLVASALNGKPVIRFDGTSDFLPFTLPINGLSGLSVFLVSSSAQDLATNNAGSKSPIVWTETGSWGMMYVNPMQKNLQWRFGTGQSMNLPTYSRPASIGSAFSLSTVIKNGTTEYAYVNGNLVQTETGKLASLAYVSDSATLGKNLYDSSFFPGDIAEVLVYTQPLSDSDRSQVEQYLLSKYALTSAVSQTNLAPTVSAGANQSITLPSSATLSGTASDDGLPTGVLTITWSVVSGPGTVTFGNTSALATTASFSAAGTYVLRLSASDGALTSTSDVTVTASTTSSSVPSGAVIINPGDNIASVMSGKAAGTTYYLKAGVHRLQQISPQQGDTFIGETGAILNGARLVTNWAQSGSYWVATGQTQVIAPDPNASASCMGDSPRCRYAEELFFDNARLKHVASLSGVNATSWFYDSASGAVYIGQNPSGHTVERSVTARAFNSSASNVTIRNLVVEKYANYSQTGAVAELAMSYWTIDGCAIRNNHGGGVRIGSGSKVLSSTVNSNGQIGIIGAGNDIVIDGNEIAYNNAAGYYYPWEAGGTKLLRSQRLVFRNNYAHDNRGPGLWTDYDNWYTVFEGNRTARNKQAGIMHELSFDATMRYNVSEQDGASEFGSSLWYGAAIANTKSRRVTVYGNTVIGGMNGIAGMQDARAGTSPTSGETFDVMNFKVYSNTVVQSSGVTAGIITASDGSVYTSWGNQYSNNTYKLWDNAAATYQWSGGMLNQTGWKSASMDTAGQWIAPTDSTFPSTKFAENDRVLTAASVEVRSLPSTTDGALLATQPAGVRGTVTRIRGPIYSGGKCWWQVRWDSGVTGWSVDTSLGK